MDLAASLPDDVLGGFLRHLAPRDLAASRCVCKSWRSVVDGRRLLRADLLPLSLGGIFLNFHQLWTTQFLSRPTTGAAVYGQLNYTCHAPQSGLYPPRPFVCDHCNGLLRLPHCVVNPATQQWALVPQPPVDMPQPPLPAGMHFSIDEYLVFDPTLSPNDFELVRLPNVPSSSNPSGHDECEEIEWPPSTLIFLVFSSKTGSWEERTFCREGEAAGMLPGLVMSLGFCHGHHSAYWQGALYIWYPSCYVLRISLADNKYRAIRLPIDSSEGYQVCDLGKSVKGIYFASLVQEEEVQPYERVLSSKLQVWFLNSPTEWVLEHDRDIIPILPDNNTDKQCNRPWILQEFDYDASEVSDEDAMADSNEALVEEAKFDWDSDNDDILEPGTENEKDYMDILGFHPYKEVVLLSHWHRVVAYHWTSSKIQDLGRLFPKFYLRRDLTPLVTKSFPYTPCWLGELPEKLNLEAQLED